MIARSDSGAESQAELYVVDLPAVPTVDAGWIVVQEGFTLVREQSWVMVRGRKPLLDRVARLRTQRAVCTSYIRRGVFDGTALCRAFARLSSETAAGTPCAG